MRDDSTSGGAVRMRGNSVRKNRPGFQKGSDLWILRAAVHFGWNRFGIQTDMLLLLSNWEERVPRYR
jgi:hypothetical protein